MGGVRYEWTRQSGRIVILRDDREVASLDKSVWAERGQGQIEGRTFTLGMDGSARTAVPVGGGPTMIARRTSVWSSEWQVSADGANYSIARANMFTLKLEVLLEGGAALGAVTGGSFWGNRPVLEIDSSVPVAHAVFLLWMAFLIRARAG